MKGEKLGNRKVVLTKWALVIFALGTAGYLILIAMQGKTPLLS